MRDCSATAIASGFSVVDCRRRCACRSDSLVCVRSAAVAADRIAVVGVTGAVRVIAINADPVVAGKRAEDATI